MTQMDYNVEEIYVQLVSRIFLSREDATGCYTCLR